MPFLFLQMIAILISIVSVPALRSRQPLESAINWGKVTVVSRTTR
jgi:hypothetical protein